MKIKTILLLIALIVIVLVIIIFRAVTNKPDSVNPKARDIPQNSSQSTFNIVSTNIIDQPIGVTDVLKIQFSSPVTNPKYEILPPIPVIINKGTNSSEILFIPDEAWAFDTTYTLKIFKETVSVDGKTLDKEYMYNFKTFQYSGI